MDQIFNSEALTELFQIETGFVEQLIQQYKETAPNLLAGIEQAAKNLDYKELERYSHSLKSSSQALGFVRLGKLCLDIENEAEEQRLKAEYVSILNATLAESLQAIDAYMQAKAA